MPRKTLGVPVEEFTRKGNMENKLEQLETKVAELNDFLNQLNTDGFTIEGEVRGFTVTITATPPEDEEADEEEEDEKDI